MPQEINSDFSAPWCRALFENPTWEPIPTPARQQHKDSTENSLLIDSLWNERGVRAVQTFLKSSSVLQDTEVIQLYSLGDGVNSIAGTCHGGVIGIMLDEVMGQLAAEIFGRYEIVTAALNVGFKRRLDTPRVVLCKAWTELGAQGRKLWIKGTVEDGVGGVFATGETLYLRMRPSL